MNDESASELTPTLRLVLSLPIYEGEDAGISLKVITICNITLQNRVQNRVQNREAGNLSQWVKGSLPRTRILEMVSRLTTPL